MTDIKYEPVLHNQKSFLEEASKRPGFREAYDALESEYALSNRKESSMIEELIPVIGLYNSLLNYGYHPEDCWSICGFRRANYVLLDNDAESDDSAE